MTSRPFIYIALTALLAALSLLTLGTGAVSIPFGAVIDTLTGTQDRETWRHIIIESRLPMVLTSIIAGASLSVSGLIMQTTFRNPLAGPSVLGVTAGASLGVALLSLGAAVTGTSSLGAGVQIVGAIAGAALTVGVLTPRGRRRR